MLKSVSKWSLNDLFLEISLQFFFLEKFHLELKIGSCVSIPKNLPLFVVAERRPRSCSPTCPTSARSTSAASTRSASIRSRRGQRLEVKTSLTGRVKKAQIGNFGELRLD